MSPARSAPPEPTAPQVICAGASQMFVLDLAAAERGEIHKVWTWPSKDSGLSEQQRKQFGNLDEVKPIDNGKRLLVCASNSGCGLIEYATGKLEWSAVVGSAHSLEMLPDDRVLVAGSIPHDRLVLFDLKSKTPDKPIWQTTLHSAHGLVWDDKRRSLWALGFDELRRYELQDWESDKPSLELKESFALPGLDGHDLRPVPGKADLLVSTEKGVWLFDRETGRFNAHPTAADVVNVKAIDIHPATGRTVYSTWGQKIALLNSDADIPLKGSTVYKVRWLCPTVTER